MLKMPVKFLSTGFTVLGLALFAACDEQAPTEPETTTTQTESGAVTTPAQIEVVDSDLAIRGATAPAKAGGGATWVLNLGDLDGDGVDDPIDNVLTFNATRGGDGTLKGQMEYHQSVFGDDFTFHGPVTCFAVYDDGTRAKFGGPITRSNDPTLPEDSGLFMWFTVFDNGQGAAAAPDRAQIFGVGDEQANEDFCASDGLPPSIFVSDVQGNFQVSGG